MEKLLNNIDKQLKFNRGKNIFFTRETPLKFIDETKEMVLNINNLTDSTIETLVNYATEKAMEEFYTINQYYTFNIEAKNNLRNIYNTLILNLKTNKYPQVTLANNHYQNLKQWLQKSNPFATKMYTNQNLIIQPVPCAEYKADLQIKVLHLNPHTVNEPVLDIGCGKQGTLVRHLSKLGVKAWGIDRYQFSESNQISSDWLAFSFGNKKWGTIISHLSFSNHFKHHHLRDDGNYLAYAKKYIEILHSLKIGGSFHYAPDLPFIETYLNRKQFCIDKFKLGVSEFKATRITRLY